MADGLDVRPLWLLWGESVRDAARRRIVPAVLVLSLLSLMLMDSCSSCSLDIQTSGEEISLDRLLGWTGLASFAVLGLWSIALAGLLALDHLRAIFDDGSATLLLARPVSKPTLALARLLGSLVVSLSAALLVCIGATVLIAGRFDLALWPGFVATVGVMLSSTTLAALAMLSSLYLPRIVSVLAVLLTVALIAVLNGIAAAGRELDGVYFAIDRFGQPLLGNLIVPLSAWSGQSTALSAGDIALRSVVWALGSVFLLLFLFARRDTLKLVNR